MLSPLGLPSLTLLAERETWRRVRIEAEPADVICEKCGTATGLSDPQPWNPVTIADTPSRGRPTEIILTQWKYRCAPCRRGFVGQADDVDGQRRMTKRLIRYIEDQSMRRPRSAIAKEVGISVDRVKALSNELADRLARHHRFPTPRVLGMDDLKLGKKIYTIFVDAETGQAVGLVPSGKAEQVEQWARANLDRERVRVLVSDLGGTNLAMTCASPASTGKRALRADPAPPVFPNAMHVADRWHLLQACQKGMSKVIAQELRLLDDEAAALKASGVKKRLNEPRRKARTLRNLRPDLLGRRRRIPPAEQGMFDAQLLLPTLEQHERLGRAFWARIELAKVHRCSTSAAARAQLQRFYAAAEHASIADEMRKAVGRIRRNEESLINYFEAQARYPDVAASALTTSSTERRNGSVRSSWRGGRGVRRFNYLRMLALYGPLHLDVDIVECGNASCCNIEGPTRDAPGLIGQDPDHQLAARHALICGSCSATSASVRAA